MSDESLLDGLKTSNAQTPDKYSNHTIDAEYAEKEKSTTTIEESSALEYTSLHSLLKTERRLYQPAPGKQNNTSNINSLFNIEAKRFEFQRNTVSVPSIADDGNRTDRSPYLVQRLIETNERNLFNHVKFNLVKQKIDQLGCSKPRVLDIGCGLQVAHKYLASLGLQFDYFGVDYEPNFNPDAVVDLLNFGTNPPSLPWAPDVILMLDVLEHLHEDVNELDKILKNIGKICAANTTMIFTLPQMYRLDRFKLKHLHYPEHKIRLEQPEWVELVNRNFTVESVQGFGFLSVIPYLPMASKHFKPENMLGRLFQYLRGNVCEWAPLKPIDLWLSQGLGHLPGVKNYSNDILLVVKPVSSVSPESFQPADTRA
ncbi:MAG: class I SAM-dependent methyltransferase [Granulosicoccus sp.]|nr:class I SAM-dependent methyltransferase [Granulosicoccus sp.]